VEHEAAVLKSHQACNSCCISPTSHQTFACVTGERGRERRRRRGGKEGPKEREEERYRERREGEEGRERGGEGVGGRGGGGQEREDSEKEGESLCVLARKCSRDLKVGSARHGSSLGKLAERRRRRCCCRHARDI
jgi:hypothetical protein